MSAKYLIFGATGSIGSNLANKLYNSNDDFISFQETRKN